jgi:hypothetical protein
MKVYGALENAQIEWFTNAGKPAAATYPYRVIYVTDLSQVQISDGTQWVVCMSNVAANAFTGTNTFAATSTFNGALIANLTSQLVGNTRLGLTTDTTTTGSITALNNVTPIVEFTGAVTGLSGIANPASGMVLMIVNRTGSTFPVKNEDTGVATAVNRILTGTGSQLTLANNASILLAYAGDSRWHVIGGSGASAASGSKNYFSQSSVNNNFETGSVSPWLTLATTYSANGVPTTITTGGTSGITLSINSTTPLSGLFDMVATKPASNVVGTGFISGVLTIDQEDLAKVMFGSFSYKASNSNFDASGTSTQSLEIWVYDVTNAVWIQPAGYCGINQNSGPGKVTFSFQTASNSTQYQVAVITPQTATTAWTCEFDSFALGPQALVLGLAGTDWAAYTPTFTGFGTVTGVSFYWKRIGDTLSIRGTATAGTVTAVAARISFPSQATSVDTTKILLPALLGRATSAQTASASAQNEGGAFIASGQTNAFSFTDIANGSLTNILAEITGSNFFGTSSQFSVWINDIPIAGWSSNVQMSSDTDTRVVDCIVANSSNLALTAGSIINFPAVLNDTHGGYSSGIYTVPVNGFYEVQIAGMGMVSGGASIFLNKNGSAYCRMLDTTTNTLGASVDVFCNAGDTLSLVSDTGSVSLSFTAFSGNSTGRRSIVSFTRRSGPSVIAASETVKASYYMSANTASVTNQAINFDTKIFDSHGAVTPSTTAWKFVAPVSGCYQVIVTATNSGGTGNSFTVFKNGAAYKGIGNTILSGGSLESGSALVQLNAGEIIDIRCGSTAPTFIGGTVPFNTYIDILRAGN